MEGLKWVIDRYREALERPVIEDTDEEPEVLAGE
jgi:hypothetical protein